jgi:hypothetical protein
MSAIQVDKYNTEVYPDGCPTTQDNGIATAGATNRLMCLRLPFRASSNADDQVLYYMRQLGGTYATQDILHPIWTSNAQLSPRTLATNGSNKASPEFQLIANVYNSSTTLSTGVSCDWQNNPGNANNASPNMNLLCNGGTLSTITPSMDLTQATAGVKMVMPVAAGTKFTESGCSTSNTTGGAFAGQFTLSQNSCVAVITMNGATGASAPSHWSCWHNDETTAAANALIYDTGSNTTTASISIPSTAGTTDVIDFGCVAY